MMYIYIYISNILIDIYIAIHYIRNSNVNKPWLPNPY